MPIEYAAILREHGFVAESSDPFDTLTVFDHEINGVLFDNSSFNLEKSEIRRQPNDLKCLPSCSLLLKNAEPREKTIRYRIDWWYSRLWYENSTQG